MAKGMWKNPLNKFDRIKRNSHCKFCTQVTGFGVNDGILLHLALCKLDCYSIWGLFDIILLMICLPIKKA